MRRRSFVQLTLAALATPSAAASRPVWAGALEALVDTLVPADAFSPSASAAGVAKKLMASIDPDQLKAGCAWVDEAAGKAHGAAFAQLAHAHRDEVVKSLEAADPAGFFTLCRHHTFFHYYADPRSWPALGYAGPPQPAGFMDAADPP